MRFRCLVMDHDDTTVNSTATIHFPSFLAYLKLVRPEASYTLEDYFRKNFDPGIMALFTGELGFSEQELEGEFRFWQDWVRTRVPSAYPGICEILRRHKDAGGYIAVVSHSMRESIERDYRENDLPEPDIIFGWEQPPEQRKPNTWPLEQIMERFGLEPQELLVVDDLKPGYDMARAAGVPSPPQAGRMISRKSSSSCGKTAISTAKPSPISTGCWRNTHSVPPRLSRRM
ncbi:MAG: HAD family hydrolase [Oscillospiraceae bacterium]